MRHLVLFFVSMIGAFLGKAQGQALPGAGFFLSTDQIVEVQEPEQWAHRQFLLRQGEASGRFYRVPMSDLLYKSKHKFSLPSMDLSERLKLPFYASFADAQTGKALNEVILNERLVLSDAESLYVRGQGDTVFYLLPISGLGITLLGAPAGTNCMRFDSLGPQPVRELPAFFYTYKGSAQVLLAQKEGHLPSEMETWADADAYAEQWLELKPYAPFAVIEALPPLQLRSDSSAMELEKLDSLLAGNRAARSRLELEFGRYLQGKEASFYAPMPRRSYEGEKTFAFRTAFRDSLLMAMRLPAGEHEAYTARLREIDGRQLILQSYRTQLASEREWRHGGAQRTLLSHFVWNRFYARVDGSLGRNMPDWAASPGPSGLWALGLGGSYMHALTPDLGIEGRLGWRYSRWDFNEDVSLSSSQSMATMDLCLIWPVAVAARSPSSGQLGGVVLSLQTGLGAGGSVVHVNGDSYESRREGALRFLGGLRLHWVDAPLVVEALYAYGTDGFGDLSLGLAWPLPWRFTKD